MVRARKITDNMAIAAAHSLANYAERRGINPENIVPNMEEAAVFPEEAADVAMQAIKDGVARIHLSKEEAFKMADTDIKYSRDLTKSLVDNGFIKAPSQEMLQNALEWAITQVS
jgi:malate dehydrogenase (oxaloacetate-decarboxylating)